MNLNVALIVALMLSHLNDIGLITTPRNPEIKIMLSTFGLEHYFNFRVLGSGSLPNIPWHLLIYFYKQSTCRLSNKRMMLPAVRLQQDRRLLFRRLRLYRVTLHAYKLQHELGYCYLIQHCFVGQEIQ